MAATDVRNDQTFNGNELRNFRLEILGSHFVSPQTGQPWYLTSDNIAYYYNGTENVPMDARARTGIPITNLASLGSGVATWLATPSSANLLAAITDETGTGALVFATSPALVTPSLGVATATTINKVTITAPATSATLTLAQGSTLATSGAFSVTFTATATTTLTLPTTGTLATLAGAESLTNKKLGSLTTNGFVKTSGSDGTLSVDTSTYLTTASAASGYQPLDADLTTIAGLTATTDSFMQAKGSAWAARTVAQVKTDLGLTGTNSGDQTITLTGDVTGSGTGSFATAIAAGVIVDADINASAAIALSKLATNPLARANHTGTQTASTISDFDTQVRTNRLDQLTAPTSAVAMGSQRITGLATPSVGTDAATKQYVDDAVVAGTSGIDAKDAVDTTSTSNLTLSGVQNINGHTGAAGVTTILVKAQSTGADNGIYVMQSGAWTRRADSAAGKLTKGSYTLVTSGTYAGTSWMLTTADPITVGTTAQTWVQFNTATSFTGGDGIDVTSGVISVDLSPATSAFEAGNPAIRIETGLILLDERIPRSIGGNLAGDGSTTSWPISFPGGSRPLLSVFSQAGQAVIPGMSASGTTLTVTIKPAIPNGEFWPYTIYAGL